MPPQVPQNRDFLSPEPRKHLVRSSSEQPAGTGSPQNGEPESLKKAQTLPILVTQRSNSFDSGPGSPRSPTLSLRDMQAESGQQFPLTNIDNPNDIAQELSNLQALRRMSMDVGNIKDPDMPPMSLSTMPAIAPSGDDDEADPSRLLWVPARVHPELAPSEFQTFLEKRVQSIKRRSGDSSLGADLNRNGSGSSLSSSSLRRTRSKLSRQIDNSGGQGASGYVDGAEQLERQISQRESNELSLDELVKDPTKAVQKLAQESQGHVEGSESSADDMPILPMAPGMGLRRSTRTTYRKGGSLRSDKRRGAHRHQNSETEPPLPVPGEAPPGHGLQRVQSEPVSDSLSQPSRSLRRQGGLVQEAPAALAALEGNPSIPEDDELRPTSPPSPEQEGRAASIPYSKNVQESPQSNRSVSQTSQPEHVPQPAVADPPPKSNRRAASHSNVAPSPPQQYTSKTQPSISTPTLDEGLQSQHPGMPGSGGTRTDALTFIPTLNQPEEKKPEKKSKKDEESTSRSSSAWKWLRGGDDKREKKEDSKKSRTKALVERAQDNVRLDVIQSSIEKSGKGRESLVLDRDSSEHKLQEERRKDGTRRSESKKEKDGSIFSSIFGGSKKKEEKDRASKRIQHHLRVPSEPPAIKPPEPDVDYHWTRFPLLEERAIYRMAHIKLANPRRPLLSQVLLSNFMYSYLAIVQAMHPQMNVPISPQQKRLEEEARRKKEEEEYLAQQQAMQDAQDDPSSLDQYDFDYHRVSAPPTMDGVVY